MNTPGLPGKPIKIWLEESWFNQRNKNIMEDKIIMQARMKSLTDKTNTEVLNNLVEDSKASDNTIFHDDCETSASEDNCEPEQCCPPSDKQIVESLDIPYEMFDNYMLVKPLKPQNIKKKIEVLDDKKNKGKQPHMAMETKRVTKSVQTDYREGVVLAVGPNAFFHANNATDEKVMLEIGDKVIFHKNLVDRSWFDLFKDSLILRNYDLVAKVK